MKLYGKKYPEPVPKNVLEIIRVCKNIHRQFLDMKRTPNNTGKKEWHRYWVRAYEAVEKAICEIKSSH